MVVVRPVQLDDLEHLLELTSDTGFGLTTLPHDREMLRKKIIKSQMSFESLQHDLQGDLFLFVLEEMESHQVVGTSGIVSQIGGFEPFYAYRVEQYEHKSKILDVDETIEVLHLVQEHSGPSEIGSLLVAASFRKGGNGRLLSLSRFLFMGTFSKFFDSEVLAEIRGLVDDEVHSPFWDALGRKFFDIDFPTADYLIMIDKKFISELMPQHPIYIRLLPPQAQEVIGKVHPDSQPALNILKAEGFRTNGMVDIFEAGPIVTCPLTEIRVVKSAKRCIVQEVAQSDITGERCIITNAQTDFRACMGSVEMRGDDGVALSGAVAAALQVGINDPIRFTRLFAGS